ncbi:FACT complex subunit-domain-containing protein [Chytridium lagenaria]|nr:FACT complex subunit-domain-containing protein [Chytridium lagenaria]
MVEIDSQTFHRRARVLLDTWKVDALTHPNNAADFGNSDAVLLIAGSTDDDIGYQKTSCLQLWLWGYEFPDTVTLFLENKIVFRRVKRKPLKNAKGVENVEIEILIQTLGVLVKDKIQGKFEVDIAVGVSTVLATKDSIDLENIKHACKLTTLIMKNYFMEEFQSIIDQGKKITHEKLAANTESCLTDDKRRSKVKFPKETVIDAVEWCYTPIIQSGGKYDLKPSAESDTNALHDGTIVCSLGLRYKGYCSNLSRTFLVNPEKGKETNYKFLLELQEHLLSILKEGVTCSGLYEEAIDYVTKNRPDLKDNFVKNIGFGGMVLNLIVGLSNLENPDSKDPKNRSDGAELLTSFDKDFKDISWEMNDDNESEISMIEEPTRNGRNGNSAVLKTKLREKDDEMTAEQRRSLHQKQLAEQRNSEGRQRFSESADTGKGSEKAIFRKFESYRQETLYLKSTLISINFFLKIVVDRKNESILLPMYGYPVPFHISTLKTLVKHEEGDTSYLRFNFITPGQSIGKKESLQPFENPNATFVKTIMYKSTDFARFAEIHRDISDFKKEIQKREAERKEMADLVEQAKLIEVKGRRPVLLRDVFVRPAIESGKRLPGDLEIHSNGLRYQSGLRTDSKIDILFSNIKHMFYQPCDGELIVVIHIRLNNKIIISKKKQEDIQFYREVSEASFDETGNRKRRYNQGDEDEFAAEQEERRRRALLNQDFRQFAEKIRDASKKLVDIDMPLRDLGFQGVPFKQPVLLLPTVNCLVHLIEPPFLVVTISEIEIVHLERVRFGLKNFDMVVVYKNFAQPVQHINCIPTDQLEHVKEWLDSVDVAYTEGPTNLMWPQIMKTINEDPANFFEEGGWTFLQPESDVSFSTSTSGAG